MYFHDDAFVQRNLTAYTSLEDVNYALDTLPNVGGKTNAAKGFRKARSDVFNNRGQSEEKVQRAQGPTPFSLSKQIRKGTVLKDGNIELGIWPRDENPSSKPE